MAKLTLPWAVKFRELMQNHRLSNGEIVAEFENYCERMEAELNLGWEEKENDRKTNNN